MDALIIAPHQGIGPLKLGMSPQEILTAVEQLRAESQLPPSTPVDISRETVGPLTCIRYQGDEFFFLVQYYQNRAVEIGVDGELSHHLPILLHGLEVFQTPAEDLVNTLKANSACIYDLEDEQLSTEYLFPQLGLRLWREMPFHPKLLSDPAYCEEMALVLDEMKAYLYFQSVSVLDWETLEQLQPPGYLFQ